MDFDITVAHRVEEVGQARWDAFSGNEMFSSSRWFQFAETVLVSEVPFYVLLSHRDKPVARAAFWLSWREPLPIPAERVRSLMQRTLQRWPLFICRTPLANLSGLILPEDPILRGAAFETFGQLALEAARQYEASFTLFDYLEQPIRTPRAFASVEMPNPGTRLNVEWGSFDEYFNHLNKSARKDYHRHLNRANDLGIRIKTHTHITRRTEALALIRQAERYHGTPANPYLERLLDYANQVQSIWLTAEIDDQLVGCGLLLGDRDTYCLAALGLDYDVKYVYFQLVYAAIRAAIEAGARVLRGGSAAYEIKQRLGFQLEANTNVIYSAHWPLVRYIAQQLIAS